MENRQIGCQAKRDGSELHWTWPWSDDWGPTEALTGYVSLHVTTTATTHHNSYFLQSDVGDIYIHVWLTVHRNSVWIRNQLDVTFVLSFISPLQVAQHVSGNHVPIFRS